jgi:hypothetical protein
MGAAEDKVPIDVSGIGASMARTAGRLPCRGVRGQAPFIRRAIEGGLPVFDTAEHARRRRQ